MKPRPGSSRHRLRLWLYRCGVRFDNFTRRPYVHRFTMITAHLAPAVTATLAAFLIVREFLFTGWRHPVVAVAVTILMLGVVFAQVAHRPDTCRRCLRRMPWGKHRIHAGRAALMASFHAATGIELAVAVAYLLFLVGDRVELPTWLVWAGEERVRSVGLTLGLLITMSWIGQARMTHRIYERSCKRCRGRRRGGGGPSGGGEPIPLPLAPHRAA